MEHPLTNPSLTPFCFTSPHRFARNRQNLKGVGTGINGDREMARHWAKANRLKNEGALPAERIVHHILDSRFRPRMVTSDFVFKEKPYRERDIFVLTCIVTWFGTNVGNSFMIDIPIGWDNAQSGQFFLKKYQHENEQWRERSRKNRFAQGPKDLVTFWTHVCTKHCRDKHDYRNDTPTETDYALADALMWWLGSKQGREFFSAFQHVVKGKHQSYLNNEYRVLKK